jgi:LytR cell envelope-related transcriptional attenuator
MNPDPRTRRGAHRTSRAASATLLPSLLAILAVTSLITALYVWRGQDSKPPPAAASARSTTPRSSSGVTTPPAASTSLPTITQQTTKGTGSNSPKAKAKATRTTAAASLRGSIAIVVLNETTRRGLAATVATRLRSNGWTVSGVGNFRGEVPATTVYYPVGHQAAALAAAKSLPTPARVLPRFGNLSTTRLTVIVTTNYPT